MLKKQVEHPSTKEAYIANEFVFLDFYVAALCCNLGFAICGSNIEQDWPPLVYSMPS